MTTKYTVITRDNRVVTRRSAADYVMASVAEDGTVRFHQTVGAAVKAAGRFGYTVTPEGAKAADVAATRKNCPCGGSGQIKVSANYVGDTVQCPVCKEVVEAVRVA